MVIKLSPAQTLGHYLILLGVALYLVGYLAGKTGAK